MLRSVLLALIAGLGALPAAQAWEIETGVGAINPLVAPAIRVDFREAFAVVPVVIATAGDGRSDPVDVRVSAVDAAGFTLAVAFAPNTVPSNDAVGYSFVAVEPGVHRMPGGQIIQAGRLDTAVTLGGSGVAALGNVTWSGTQAPAVLVAPQTDRSGLFLTGLSNRPDADGFAIALERPGGGQPATAETLGYIAIEPGISRFDSGTDPLPIAVEAIAGLEGVGGPDDDVDGLPLTAFPVDCRRVSLGIVALGAVAGRNGIADGQGAWARSCSAATGLTTVPLVLDEDLPSPRTSSGDAVALLAFERAFHATIGRIGDYRFDACDGFGATSTVVDEGPYGLDGQGIALARVDVTALTPIVAPAETPGPLCYAAGLGDPGAQVTVVESGSDRFGVSGALTLAAWVNPAAQADPAALQTLAGKGGDSYRLALEAVCVSVPLTALDPALVLGAADDPGSLPCRTPPLIGEIVSAEWKYVLRADVVVVQDVLGTPVPLRLTARSGSTAVNALWDPAGEVVPGRWHHGALSYDGTRLRVYLDGIERNGLSAGAIALPINENDAPFAIGVSVDDTGARSDALTGSIDEVGIWNVALTTAELDEDHRLLARDCEPCRTLQRIYWRERILRQ